MDDRELSHQLGRIEGKLDAINVAQGQQDLRLANHSMRISSLERSRAWLHGAWASVSAGCATTLGSLYWYFSGKH